MPSGFRLESRFHLVGLLWVAITTKTLSDLSCSIPATQLETHIADASFKKSITVPARIVKGGVGGV